MRVELIELGGELAQEAPVGHVHEQVIGIFVDYQPEEVLQRTDSVFAEIGVDAETALSELDVGAESLKFEDRTHGETFLTDETSGAFVEDEEHQSVVVPGFQQLEVAAILSDVADVSRVDGIVLIGTNIVDFGLDESLHLLLVGIVEQLIAIAMEVDLIHVTVVLFGPRAGIVTTRRATLHPVVTPAFLLLLVHDEGSHELLVCLGVSFEHFSDVIAFEFLESGLIAGFLLIIAEEGHADLVVVFRRHVRVHLTYLLN